MSKIYEAVEKRMPNGTLAYGFHRVLLVDDWTPLGAWVCQDCGKRWSVVTTHPYSFDIMKEDKVCEQSIRG